MPLNGIAIPKNGITIPKTSITIPENGMPMPINGIAIPQNGITIPKTGIAIPKKGIAIPKNGIAIPKNGITTLIGDKSIENRTIYTMKNIKYVMAMVLLVIGMNVSDAQTKKNKPTVKPKGANVVKQKADTLSNKTVTDSASNAAANAAPKKAKGKQEKKDVKDEEVELSRPYQPTLSEGYKISNSPQIEQAKLDIPKMDYSVKPKAFPTWYDVLPINAAKMKDEKPEPLKGNLVKLGYGNYDNAYGELFLNNNRNKDYSIGAHLKHLSSSGKIADYPNSQFSDNLIDVYGKRYLENETVSGDLNFKNNGVNYYGYSLSDTSKNSSNGKQHFNTFNAQVGFQSNYLDKTHFAHDINLKFYNLADAYSNQETGISLDGLLKSSLGKDQWLTTNVLADNNSIKFKQGASYSNMIAGIAPQYTFKQGDLNMGLGFNAMFEIDKKTFAHLYPKIDFSYAFADNSLVAYATFTGGMEKHTLKTTSNENPFIKPQYIGLPNSNNKKDITAGIKGSLSNAISFNLRGGYKEVVNMPFYTIEQFDTLPENKFVVATDSVQIVNAHLELSYQQSESLRIILSGDYNHYNNHNITFAWYKPTFTSNLSIIYNSEKFTVKGDVFVLSDRKANYDSWFFNTIRPSVNLKTIADINLGIAYHYTKSLSFFLNLNNITNSQYQLWYLYPSQRFNLLGGFSYAF